MPSSSDHPVPEDTKLDELSFLTTAESNINEVIPDFCVLAQIATLSALGQKSGYKLLRTLLQKISMEWLAHKFIRILRVEIPLLIELKRPVTRHAADIGLTYGGWLNSSRLLRSK